MATDAKDLHSSEHSLSGSDTELAAGQVGDPGAKTDPFPATIVDPPQQSAPSAAEKVTEQLVEMTANGTKKVMAPLFPPPKGKNKKKKMKKKIEPAAPAQVPQVRVM